MIKSYIKFLLASTNQHGVHSPFVYDLVTKCFYDKSRFSAYQTLKNYRNTLLKNNDVIQVTDFGAGSRVFKSNQRKVRDIAQNAGISRKRAKLLFRITNYFKPENILEIGTSLGLATSALALAHPKAKVTSLEGCPNTMAQGELQLQKFDINNVTCINTEFSDYLKGQHNSDNKFQLVYFDGNHSQKATLDYFELLLPTVTNDTLWIFDDIHWSADMEQAWEKIKNHDKVKVTIDTFQWGLVFFRKEQEKEHFIIRV